MLEEVTASRIDDHYRR